MIKSKSKGSISKTRGPKDGHLGISSSALKRGTNKFRQISNLSSHTQRVSGTEIVGRVTISGTPSSGDILFSRKNASNPIGTRLERLAPLYKRWRVHRYTYRFVSSLPTSVIGSYVLAQDPDPIAQYSTSDSNNVNKLMTLEGAKMRQFWQNAEVSLSSSNDYTSLWTTDLAPSVTDVSDRLAYAGQVFMVLANSTSAVGGTDIGFMELEFDIEFFSPTLSQQSIDDNVPWLNYAYSAWKTYIGTRQNDSFFSYFDNLISATYSLSATLGTLFKVLREVNLWTPQALVEGQLLSPDPSEKKGVPKGLYGYHIFVGALTETTNASFTIRTANNDAGTFWNLGDTDATAVPYGLTALTGAKRLYGPDGILYPYAAEWTGQFTVLSERGFPALYLGDGVVTPNAGTRIFMRITAHDSNKRFVASSPGGHLGLAPDLVRPSYSLKNRVEFKEKHFATPIEDTELSSLATPKLVRTRREDNGYEVVSTSTGDRSYSVERKAR